MKKNILYFLGIMLLSIPLNSLSMNRDPNGWALLRDRDNDGAAQPTNTGKHGGEKQFYLHLGSSDVARANSMNRILNITSDAGPAAEKAIELPGEKTKWQLEASGGFSTDKELLSMYETLEKAKEHFNPSTTRYTRIDGESFFVISVAPSHTKEKITQWYQPAHAASPIDEVYTQEKFSELSEHLTHRNNVRSIINLGLMAYFRQSSCLIRDSLFDLSLGSPCCSPCCYLRCCAIGPVSHWSDQPEYQIVDAGINEHLAHLPPSPGFQMSCIGENGCGPCVCFSRGCDDDSILETRRATVETIARKHKPAALEMKRD